MNRNWLIEKMFERRGYTTEYVKEIEQFDHKMLKDADVLCQKLYDIYLQKKHVVFIPDFDVDGIACGIVGYAGLAELGFHVSLYIPDPSQGYGFNAKTIMQLVAQYPTVEVILTGDVGISCYEGIDMAKQCGIEVLITDHHKQEQLSSADCVVNPMRLDETYEHPQICGAYVLYQCLQLYADTYCNRFVQEQIRRLRVFAGIGTISDTMPLLYENRQLVRDSITISRLIYASGDDFIVNHIIGNDVYRRAFRGLYLTFCMFADMGKITSNDDINEDFFGYYLAPMFNSVKRMGADMTRSFGVFFGPNPEEDVNYLYQLNNERKLLVSHYFEELQSTDQPYAPYIYLSDAPSGILGLLAQKLIVTSGVPTIVVRQDDNHFHGSGRSPMWYPFLDRTVFICHAAGHNPAFGVGFTDKKELKAFHAFLAKDVQDVLSVTELPETTFQPDFVIAHDGTGDTVIDILLFAEYLQELSRYHPFGQGFAAPCILLKFKPEDGEWSVMGGTKQHLKIRLAHGFEVLLWNQSNQINRKDMNRECFVVGQLGMSEYLGNHTINFIGDFMEVDD